MPRVHADSGAPRSRRYAAYTSAHRAKRRSLLELPVDGERLNQTLRGHAELRLELVELSTQLRRVHPSLDIMPRLRDRAQTQRCS